MMDTEFVALRPLLFSVAYRITGSRADTEDILQEAYLRWQTVDQESIESPRAFLTTMVSRLSLDTLKAARRKREVYIGPWLPEPVLGPMNEPAELAESLSFAFLHLLESLKPQERTAFLMHDVFDNSYAEVAEMLETSEVNARQMVSRARTHLRAERPKRRVDPQKHEHLFGEFMRACAEGDASTLLALLKQDVVLYSDGGGKASAAINPVTGAERVIRFLVGLTKKPVGDIGGYLTLVNGSPGAVVTVDGNPYCVLTVEFENETIRTVYFILNPDKLNPPLLQ
jgi:RNA polymerase sigma-70 factor, ECF subfamily